MKLEEILQLNPRETLLLVIDIQKDFLESQLGFTFFDAGDDLAYMQSMVKEQLIPFIRYSLGRYAHIVYIQANYQKGKFPPPYDTLCSKSPGKDFYLIDQVMNDNVRIFSKSEHDPFTNPHLRRHMQENNIRNLILTGVTLTSCIKAAVDSAILIPDLSIIVPRDCVASRFERMEGLNGHKAILSGYEANPQIKVLNSVQIQYQS